mmetsp:Transcript_22325/g.48190  ORF Transcript_22325/g.48190 Transcript_22325/m.48190 type:complete len:214 (-) Transcript_22325:245-886(-)
MRKQLRVAVGSANPVKINAVRAAFRRNFAVDVLEVEGLTTESGVPDQPWGEEQTQLGALNRAMESSAAYTARHGVAPDFAVGLEGGVLSERLGAVHAAHWSGPPLPEEMVHCFAWMAVLRPATETTEQRWGLARTASFMLPDSIVGLMRGSDGNAPMELGAADDAIFSDVNSKQKGGTVAKVTNGVIDRTAYYEHALHLALAPFLHSETRVYG